MPSRCSWRRSSQRQRASRAASPPAALAARSDSWSSSAGQVAAAPKQAGSARRRGVAHRAGRQRWPLLPRRLSALAVRGLDEPLDLRVDTAASAAKAAATCACCPATRRRAAPSACVERRCFGQAAVEPSDAVCRRACASLWSVTTTARPRLATSAAAAASRSPAAACRATASARARRSPATAAARRPAATESARASSSPWRASRAARVACCRAGPSAGIPPGARPRSCAASRSRSCASAASRSASAVAALLAHPVDQPADDRIELALRRRCPRSASRPSGPAAGGRARRRLG